LPHSGKKHPRETQPETPIESQMNPQNSATDGEGKARAEGATPSLEEQLASALDERDRMRDQMLRAFAEVQNQRKRLANERDAMRQFILEELMSGMIPVLDNLERSLAAADAGASRESLLEGVRGVERQFRTVLESFHVRRINAKGKMFDPNLHEAVSTVATAELPEGTVVEEIESGYTIREGVLRPAKVQVAKRS